MFPCKRWLDKSEDDGKIERTLLPGASGGTIYQIKVTTGKVSGAGTDANVHAQIIGEKGKTEILKLTQSNHLNMFEEGQTDTFAVEGSDVGKVSTLTIGHDNAGLGASWFVDSVVVTDLGSGAEFTFPCNQWFDKKKGDGVLERTLKPSAQQ